MKLTSLPESLSIDDRKIFTQPRLQTAMLDLDHLATLIRNGEEKALCREWLHGREEEKLHTLLYEKRHLEWLGGRICAKAAGLQYLYANNLVSWGQNSILSPRTLSSAALHAPLLQVMSSASGRPFLDPGGLPEGLNMPHISISHSRGYALAVAASSPCGVDIQAESESLIRVKDRFCSRAEEELLENKLNRLLPTTRLTLLWAAKEAVKKAALAERMPGFLDLVLTHIESNPETGGHAHCLFTLDSQESNKQLLSPPLQFLVTVYLHKGYGIGLCVIPSQPSTGVDNA